MWLTNSKVLGDLELLQKCGFRGSQLVLINVTIINIRKNTKNVWLATVYLTIDTCGNKETNVTFSGEIPNFPKYEQPEFIGCNYPQTLFR